jgi:hypothetical protein
MLQLVEVLGRVAIRRIVAAADMAAGEAKTQVHPIRPGLEAFLAAVAGWPHGVRAVCRFFEMLAGSWH